MEIDAYKSGKNIVLLFSSLVKAVQVYDLNNEVVQNAARKFFDYVTSLFNTFSYLELFRHRDYVFFNKHRLRFDIYGYASLQFISDRLQKSKIKSLTFLPDISQTEATKFASLFTEEGDAFLKRFASEQFNHINLEFETGEEEIPEFLQDRDRIKRTYFKALKVTKNLMHNLWTNQPADVRRFRRSVFSLVDSLSQDEFSVLALTTIKNFDEYTYNHSLNVGVLSMALGQRIGLNKKSMAKLGTAGMLHDIGKVEIPKELIYKSDELTDEEWETLKLHSHYGVREILKTKGLDEIGLVSMIVSLQHHWNYDGTGYPHREKNEKPTFFAKVVRICDAYDAMTTPRPYQPIPYLPYFAIRVLWRHKNTDFDPILVKVFIQLLGLYPVGSCLELSSRDIGLVMRENPSYLDLPIIKIVIDKEGKEVDGKMLDLSVERDLQILKPVYPQQYGISPASHLI